MEHIFWGSHLRKTYLWIITSNILCYQRITLILKTWGYILQPPSGEFIDIVIFESWNIIQTINKNQVRLVKGNIVKQVMKKQN